MRASDDTLTDRSEEMQKRNESLPFAVWSKKLACYFFCSAIFFAQVSQSALAKDISKSYITPEPITLSNEDMDQITGSELISTAALIGFGLAAAVVAIMRFGRHQAPNNSNELLNAVETELPPLQADSINAQHIRGALKLDPSQLVGR